MTTAQWTGRLECELMQDCWDKTGVKGHRACVAVRKDKGSEYWLRGLTDRMEKEDTGLERVAGYGLSVLTLIYMGGHVLKALF